MKLKKKISWYLANLVKARAYTKLLEAVDEIQKFDRPVCFSDYPDINHKCALFKADCACKSKTCPLVGINKIYINASQQYDKSRIAYTQAKTGLFCALVQDRQK